MKLYPLVLIILFVAIDAFAATSTRPIISKKEAKAVLKSNDNACGDTWCEGEYGFSFNDFSCITISDDRANCTLRFTMSTVVEIQHEFRTQTTVRKENTVSCEITNLRRESIVKKASNGSTTYTEHLFKKISDCIASLEEHLQNN